MTVPLKEFSEVFDSAKNFNQLAGALNDSRATLLPWQGRIVTSWHYPGKLELATISERIIQIHYKQGRPVDQGSALRFLIKLINRWYETTDKALHALGYLAKAYDWAWYNNREGAPYRNWKCFIDQPHPHTYYTKSQWEEEFGDFPMEYENTLIIHDSPVSWNFVARNKPQMLFGLQKREALYDVKLQCLEKADGEKLKKANSSSDLSLTKNGVK